MSAFTRNERSRDATKQQNHSTFVFFHPAYQWKLCYLFSEKQSLYLLILYWKQYTSVFDVFRRWSDKGHDDVMTWRNYWRFVRGLQWSLNTLRPRQNGCHFPDDSFKWIFLNENVWISIEVSLKFVSKGPINNIPALVQIMAWRRPGDKPLSEPMVVSLLTHICVTRPQWVKKRQ